MKLNLEYYKSDLLYDKTVTIEEENKILNCINNYEEKDYYKILEADDFVNARIALTNDSNNSIKWYDFKKDSNILHINMGFGEITRELCEKSNKVTAIEPIKARAEAMGKRFKDIDNLEVISANIFDVNFKEKFDYVIFYGSLENSDILFEKDEQSIEDNLNSAEKLINYVKKLVKDNGNIIILTNNKFGVKNFTGITENIDELPYDSILGNCKLYSKNDLQNILKNSGLNNYKFYYMLPDYKLTNVIFSDDYIPKENDTKIIYNNYCNERSLIAFNEVNLLKEVTKDNKFDFFCNSFFIDISINEKEKSINPKFISYNNMRKKDFKLITKLYNNVVVKEVKSDESINHLNNISKNIDMLKKHKFNIIDSYKDNKIYSKFVESNTYDKELLKYIDTNQIDSFFNSIENWYVYIKENLKTEKYSDGKFKQNIFTKQNVDISDELLLQMQFVENGFIDLVFENTFFIDEKFVFFDQEWYFQNVPVEYILYRALNNLYSYNSNIEKVIPIHKSFEKFNIDKYIEKFNNLEKNFQNYVIDEFSHKLYNDSNRRSLELYIENIKQEGIKKLQEEKIKSEEVIQEFINFKEESNNKFNNLKEETDKKIQELNDELQFIYNSRTWKYTEIFRKKNR